MKILNSLATIESGMAVLLIPILFSISFFLGRVAEHFFIAINFSRKNKDDKEKKVKSLEVTKETKGEIWGNKIFSFSSSCGLLILGTMLFILAESCSLKWAILVVSVILLFGTVSSLVYWRYLDKTVNQ
jgi:hypothetical protein